MKKLSKLLAVVACVGFLFAGCDNPNLYDEKKDGDPNKEVTLNVYAFSDEVPNMIKKYCELHPEDKITIKNTIVGTNNGNQYIPALDAALQDNTVDIYAAESAFLLKYSKGAMSEYAMPYEDLGIDIDYAVQAAKIAPYTIDLGSNKAGKINALWYQSTGGCFIYRRSIAKEVFGTDDPAVINEIIGGGTNSWDNFWKVAAKCAEKGVAVVSGDGDLWHAMESSADKGWIVDGKLYIDPKREKFLDFSKDLTDKGYSNQTIDWTKGWYDDMSGKGEKPVFGFFGPAWLINYTIAKNCGGEAVGEGTYGDWAVCSSPVGFCWGGTGVLVNKNIDESKKKAVRKIIEWITLDTTKDGLLYKWASGTLYGENGTKDAVASGVVMAQTDGTMAFLGGQNMYDYFVPANQYATGKLFTELDETINAFWRDQVRAYASGQKTREEAIADFKAIVLEELEWFGIASE